MIIVATQQKYCNEVKFAGKLTFCDRSQPTVSQGWTITARCSKLASNLGLQSLCSIANKQQLCSCNCRHLYFRQREIGGPHANGIRLADLSVSCVVFPSIQSGQYTTLPLVLLVYKVYFCYINCFLHESINDTTYLQNCSSYTLPTQQKSAELLGLQPQVPSPPPQWALHSAVSTFRKILDPPLIWCTSLLTYLLIQFQYMLYILNVHKAGDIRTVVVRRSRNPSSSYVYILYTARSAIPGYQLSAFGCDIVDKIHNPFPLLSDGVYMCPAASPRHLDLPLTLILPSRIRYLISLLRGSITFEIFVVSYLFSILILRTQLTYRLYILN